MSTKTIEQQKSAVSIEYNPILGKDVVTKRYKTHGQDTGDLVAPGNFLRSSSSIKHPAHYHGVESGLLRVMNGIDDNIRSPPRLYSSNDQELTITMEYLDGRTYRDELVDALSSGENPVDRMDYMPRQVAELHRQLGEKREELIETIGKNTFKARSRGEEKRRLWHYLSRIIYYMSPDLKDLRERAEEGHLESSIVDRGVKKYVNERLSTIHRFPGSVDNFLTNFAKADQELLYEGLNLGVPVIHGDLGPQHIYTNGRVLDFDEARLGPTEIDLVASAYNIFTYPKSREEEDRLVDLALTYLDTMHGENEVHSKQKAGLFLAKLVECRLKETLRLFAVDIKASPAGLRGIVKGHPYYDNIPDKDLKEVMVYNLFVDGFKLFFDYFQRGKGKSRLNKTDYADDIYAQVDGVEQLLSVTKVLQSPDVSGITRIDQLLDGD